MLPLEQAPWKLFQLKAKEKTCLVDPDIHEILGIACIIHVGSYSEIWSHRYCKCGKKIINISLAPVWDNIAQPLAALALFTRATFIYALILAPNTLTTYKLTRNGKIRELTNLVKTP